MKSSENSIEVFQRQPFAQQREDETPGSLKCTERVLWKVSGALAHTAKTKLGRGQIANCFYPDPVSSIIDHRVWASEYTAGALFPGFALTAAVALRSALWRCSALALARTLALWVLGVAKGTGTGQGQEELCLVHCYLYSKRLPA